MFDLICLWLFNDPLVGECLAFLLFIVAPAAWAIWQER